MFPRLYKPLKKQSFFMFGPRGTGKTTWLKTQFPDSPRLDLLDAHTAQRLLADPTRLLGMLPNPPSARVPIIIDEIQKAPGLLDEVHRLIQDKGLIFVLTGSSARKLRRGSANLLAGRAIQRYFFPLTLWELGEAFDLKRALQFGLLPQAWNSPHPRDFLSSYVYTYLKEEVFAEGLTRNLEAFARFLECASFSQAQPIKMTSIAADVGIDSKVIASYFDVLEDLLIGVRLPVFTRRAQRRMTAAPKFFYFDSGVYRSIRPRGPLDAESEIDGPALETLFLQHWRALCEALRWEDRLYHWRTSDHREVDFVSYGPHGLFAFEIKRSTQVRDEDLRGLKLFGEDYPVAQRFLLCGSEREEVRDGIRILPFALGLERLPELITGSPLRPV